MAGASRVAVALVAPAVAISAGLEEGRVAAETGVVRAVASAALEA